MREFWTGLASIMGVFAFFQTLLTTLFPPQLRFTLLKSLSRITSYFSSYCYFDITEIDGVNTNELYNAVQLYLSTASVGTSRRLSITRAMNSSGITYGLASNDVMDDTFNGVNVQWEHIVVQRNSQGFSWRPMPEEKRGFTLRVKKNQKGVLLNDYLDYIMEKAVEIRRKNEDRYLYTNSRGGSVDSRGPQPWEAVPFKHPSTFNTLAMDPHLKAEIKADLREFASGQSFYQKTGRAWKRGYLLYGPPGTGKSSMIAAMANYLGYDIYDLELTEVNGNSELRKLLMKTTSKSIIVIEDIDCSITLTNRAKDDGNNNKGKKGKGTGGGGPYDSGMVPPGDNHHQPPQMDGNGDSAGNSVTLSGLLNFTDGLWSCCGSERIFVFTTNHIERLDPALLRSGRMDMHIHMSYCRIHELRILLQNYLGGGDHQEGNNKWQCPKEFSEVMKRVEEIVEEAEMTPADVSEVLLRNRRDSGRAVRELLEEMKRRVVINKKKLLTSRNGDAQATSEVGTVEEETMTAAAHKEEEEEEDDVVTVVNGGDDGYPWQNNGVGGDKILQNGGTLSKRKK